MYQDFTVTFANGVKRTFHETAADIRETAGFYAPSFGRIVKVVKVVAK